MGCSTNTWGELEPCACVLCVLSLYDRKGRAVKPELSSPPRAPCTRLDLKSKIFISEFSHEAQSR